MHDDTKLKILKALADPTRLSIVRTIVTNGCPTSCRSVLQQASLSQPAMSHHLSKLVDARILIEHKDGSHKYYKIDYELLESMGLDLRKL